MRWILFVLAACSSTSVAPVPPAPPTLFGATFALPDEVRAVPLGMTLERGREVAPAWTPANLLAPVQRASRIPGVAIHVDVEAEKWVGALAYVPAEEAVIDLRPTWSGGRRATIDGTAAEVWLDPKAGLRAIYTGNSLSFDAYRPLASLVGRLGRLGFEHTPILGMTYAQVAAAYADWPGRDEDTSGSVIGLTFPPTEESSARTAVSVTFTNGIATTIDIYFVRDIELGGPDLASLWGPGIPKDDRVMYVDVASGRRAFVGESSRTTWWIQISWGP